MRPPRTQRCHCSGPSIHTLIVTDSRELQRLALHRHPQLRQFEADNAAPDCVDVVSLKRSSDLESRLVGRHGHGDTPYTADVHGTVLAQLAAWQRPEYFWRSPVAHRTVASGRHPETLPTPIEQRIKVRRKQQAVEHIEPLFVRLARRPRPNMRSAQELRQCQPRHAALPTPKIEQR